MFDILKVDDHLMPHDEWMLLERDDGGMTLALRRSAGPVEAIIADAWGASRLLGETMPPKRGRIPTQRHPSGVERAVLRVV